jgi:hypothetical protein
MRSTRTHTPPPTIEWLGYEERHYNFNISESVSEDETYTIYESNQLIISNPVTLDKITAALESNGFGTETTEELEIPDQAEFPKLDVNLVPHSITSAQGKLVLHTAGLLETVEHILSQAGRAEQIYWTDWVTWTRDSAILNKLAPMIGWGDSELDEFFVKASTFV